MAWVPPEAAAQSPLQACSPGPGGSVDAPLCSASRGEGAGEKGPGTGRLTRGVEFPLRPPRGALLEGLPVWTSPQAGLLGGATVRPGRCPGCGDTGGAQAQPLWLELQIPRREGPRVVRALRAPSLRPM